MVHLCRHATLGEKLATTKVWFYRSMLNQCGTCFPTRVCDMALRKPSGRVSFVLLIGAPSELFAR